jgi:hypothetical protein
VKRARIPSYVFLYPGFGLLHAGPRARSREVTQTWH